MKSYLKLVHFEISRFFKLYLILIGLTIVCQFIGAINVAKGYMSLVDQVMFEQQLSVSQFIEDYGAFSFQWIVNSGWFWMSVYICIAMLMIYVFFIWYRDWFGKNSFIYRLFMLPTARMNIYFAKLTAIMLLVLGLSALQLVLVLIEIQIGNRIVPADFRKDFPLHEIQRIDLFSLMYPNTLVEFFMMYGFGLIFVAVVFTAILIERSYRLKGIFFAVMYGMLSIGVFYVPFFLNGFYTRYFYPLEFLLMGLVTSFIVFGSAIWIANHLLKHKIRV